MREMKVLRFNIVCLLIVIGYVLGNAEGNKFIRFDRVWEYVYRCNYKYYPSADCTYKIERMRFDEAKSNSYWESRYYTFGTFEEFQWDCESIDEKGRPVGCIGDIKHENYKYITNSGYDFLERDRKVTMLPNLIREIDCMPPYTYTDSKYLNIYEEEIKDDYDIYDFNAQVGDTIRSLFYSPRAPFLVAPAIVTEIYDVEIPGDGLVKARRVRNIGGFPKNGVVYIDNTYIEGIGNIGYGDYTRMISPYHPEENLSIRDLMRYGVLNRVYDLEGNIIYRGLDIDIPNSGSVTEVEAAIDDGVIYDLMGRSVKNPLPGTLYIRNGKKFVFSGNK